MGPNVVFGTFVDVVDEDFVKEDGYTNVWTVKEGIVGWIKAGHPVCNEFAGIFKVTEYHKHFTEMDKAGKPMYRIREFH